MINAVDMLTVLGVYAVVNLCYAAWLFSKAWGCYEVRIRVKQNWPRVALVSALFAIPVAVRTRIKGGRQ